MTRDLLQMFGHSARGTPTARFITNQNPDRISLIPEILIGGVLALTTTMDTFKVPKFKKIHKFDLVRKSSSNHPSPLILITVS
ncbi:hypothetical protein VP01_651g2 [Puccinia sorghi]|uniref:Uncharacterized protein n=1 Tax=Puccinia sorghi TaxID=27349 RepID=A0A0L6UHM4_9BASI|nr:hypothetical protein VP01_651g2 [Puccinia sorghi]